MKFIDFLNEKITTSKGFIRVDGVQTGWSVEKEGTDWVLRNFDGEEVYRGSSKNAVLSHYESWYVH